MRPKNTPANCDYKRKRLFLLLKIIDIFFPFFLLTMSFPLFWIKKKKKNYEILLKKLFIYSSYLDLSNFTWLFVYLGRINNFLLVKPLWRVFRNVVFVSFSDSEPVRRHTIFVSLSAQFLAKEKRGREWLRDGDNDNDGNEEGEREDGKREFACNLYE